MDEHGWDIQVCLPIANNGNFAYRVALKDVELGAAMCRAYTIDATSTAAPTRSD